MFLCWRRSARFPPVSVHLQICDECKGSFARGCEANRWSHWTCSSLETIFQPMRINSVPDVKCFCNYKNVLCVQSMVWHFVRHPVYIKKCCTSWSWYLVIIKFCIAPGDGPCPAVLSSVSRKEKLCAWLVALITKRNYLHRFSVKLQPHFTNIRKCNVLQSNYSSYSWLANVF
jgi:hypothetical protein